MSRYLAMLRDEERKNENAGGGTLKNLKNPIEGGSLGFLGTPPAHFQKHEAAENIIETPANDPSPHGGGSSAADRERPPLVSQEDLHQIMRHLLTHLATCRDCVVEDHLYCQQGGRDGSGYQGFLCEFPDAEQRHADFVGVVIQARIRGLQAGFTALEALTRHDRDAGRETPSMPVYGIDRRPAELAFVNHFTACTYCFPRSGKYCTEGRELHDLALLEGTQ
jgi:hypothetical protein